MGKHQQEDGSSVPQFQGADIIHAGMLTKEAGPGKGRCFWVSWDHYMAGYKNKMDLKKAVETIDLDDYCVSVVRESRAGKKPSRFTFALVPLKRDSKDTKKKVHQFSLNDELDVSVWVGSISRILWCRRAETTLPTFFTEFPGGDFIRKAGRISVEKGGEKKQFFCVIGPESAELYAHVCDSQPANTIVLKKYLLFQKMVDGAMTLILKNLFVKDVMTLSISPDDEDALKEASEGVRRAGGILGWLDVFLSIGMKVGTAKQTEQPASGAASPKSDKFVVEEAQQQGQSQLQTTQLQNAPVSAPQPESETSAIVDVALEEAPQERLPTSPDARMEGYLRWTVVDEEEATNEYWVVLEQGVLSYYADMLEFDPIGSVNLSSGFDIEVEQSRILLRQTEDQSIRFILSCSDDSDFVSWVGVMNFACSRVRAVEGVVLGTQDDDDYEEDEDVDSGEDETGNGGSQTSGDGEFDESSRIVPVDVAGADVDDLLETASRRRKGDLGACLARQGLIFLEELNSRKCGRVWMVIDQMAVYIFADPEDKKPLYFLDLMDYELMEKLDGNRRSRLAIALEYLPVFPLISQAGTDQRVIQEKIAKRQELQTRTFVTVPHTLYFFALNRSDFEDWTLTFEKAFFVRGPVTRQLRRGLAQVAGMMTEGLGAGPKRIGSSQVELDSTTETKAYQSRILEKDILKEGMILVHKGHIQKKWEQYYFLLIPQYLIYFKTANRPAGLDLEGAYVIPLDHCEIEVREPKRNKFGVLKYGFNIDQTPCQFVTKPPVDQFADLKHSKYKHHALFLDSDAECGHWIACLEQSAQVKFVQPKKKDEGDKSKKKEGKQKGAAIVDEKAAEEVVSASTSRDAALRAADEEMARVARERRLEEDAERCRRNLERREQEKIQRSEDDRRVADLDLLEDVDDLLVTGTSQFGTDFVRGLKIGPEEKPPLRFVNDFIVFGTTVKLLDEVAANTIEEKVLPVSLRRLREYEGQCSTIREVYIQTKKMFDDSITKLNAAKNDGSLEIDEKEKPIISGGRLQGLFRMHHGLPYRRGNDRICTLSDNNTLYSRNAETGMRLAGEIALEDFNVSIPDEETSKGRLCFVLTHAIVKTMVYSFYPLERPGEPDEEVSDPDVLSWKLEQVANWTSLINEIKEENLPLSKSELKQGRSGARASLEERVSEEIEKVNAKVSVLADQALKISYMAALFDDVLLRIQDVTRNGSVVARLQKQLDEVMQNYETEKVVREKVQHQLLNLVDQH